MENQVTQDRFQSVQDAPGLASKGLQLVAVFALGSLCFSRPLLHSLQRYTMQRMTCATHRGSPATNPI